SPVAARNTSDAGACEEGVCVNVDGPMGDGRGAAWAVGAGRLGRIWPVESCRHRPAGLGMGGPRVRRRPFAPRRLWFDGAALLQQPYGLRRAGPRARQTGSG